MKVVLAEGDVVVVDDVLDTAGFAAVQRELAGAAYQSVHAHGWDRAWRLCDGSPLRGAAVYYDPASAFDWTGARYPTSSVIDQLVDALRALTEQHSQVVGTEGGDWAGFVLSPWLYPAGSALSLHRDAGDYSGAFTYFAHPRWGLHWGGELMLLDPAGTVPPPLGETGWLLEDDVGTGLATCVSPRPNRLVLVGPDRPHLISRVDANAGDHVRTSLAGFFLRR